MTCLFGFAAIAWASRSFADVHRASRHEKAGSRFRRVQGLTFMVLGAHLKPTNFPLCRLLCMTFIYLSLSLSPSFSPSLCTCTYIYMHTSYIHTYIHTYIRTYILTYAPTHTYICMYVCAYIHTYIHTYLTTYLLHTHRCFGAGRQTDRPTHPPTD